MISKNIIFTSLAVVFAAESTALAGWNSGGGELFSDTHNPWFVSNTSTVTYCIEIDQEHFGAPIEQVRNNLSAAISYWRDHFTRNTRNAINGILTIPIGTQNFVEEACSNNIDIKFQFGTLTQEQAAFLKHPNQVIGSAVRTEYNRQTLKGRGFLYISPEEGPNALTGTGSSLDNYRPLPNRWTHAGGKVLEWVLIHELGHVFGFQHKDSSDLMAEDGPRYWVGDQAASYINERTPHPLFEKTFDAGIYCDGHCFSAYRPADNLFGAPSKEKPVEIRYNSTSKTFEFFQEHAVNQFVRFGYTKPALGSIKYSTILTVYVTPEQRVYPVEIPAWGSVATSSFVSELSATATYVAAGIVREIKIDWTTSYLTLNTIDNGKYIEPVSFWSVDIRPRNQ